MAQEARPPDLSLVHRLIMDKFDLFKGRRYAMVAICADNQQVLWLGECRSRKAVTPFFEVLWSAACSRIEGEAMDLKTVMDREVKAHCPNP